MGRVDTTALTAEQLSQKLLISTKKGLIKEAITLVENGADPNWADQVGNSAMHHAALGGYLDLIVKMAQNGGSVRKMDENGETPLHKAARRGNFEILIALVVHEGDINILNMLGQGALELAVISKEVATVDVCCKLGAECVLQDWTWCSGGRSKLHKKDRHILDLLVKQSSRYPGFKYGSIMYKVLHLQQISDALPVPLLDMTIRPENVRDNFFLYCGKMHPEYSEISSKLQPEESVFSDVYEFIAWGKMPNKLTIDVIVTGVPTCSERLQMKLIEGSNLGTIDSFEIFDNMESDDKCYTTVTITVPLRKNGSVIFGITTTDIPETFTVTGAAVSIQPTMEPGAKIDIPDGAFQGQGNLQVNIAETKHVLRDDTESNEPLLITNIIDLSMSDGMQPQKAVQMKLPIHTTTDKDVVILASQEEYPEEEEDWEIIETKNHTTFVSFDVNHFSFYVAGSKTNYKKAAKLANIALRKERRIEVFVMAKYETEKNSTIVIECALKRGGKRRRKTWKKKGFYSQSPEYVECFIRSQQKFQLTFPETLPVQAGHEETIFMVNPRKKKNYMTFSILHEKERPCGEIQIVKIPDCDEEHKGETTAGANYDFKRKQKKWSVFCGADSKVIDPVQIQAENPTKELEILTSLSVELKPPANEEQAGNIEQSKISADDPDCPIKCTVLRLSSLKKLSEHLTYKDSFCLGTNLGLSLDILNELKKKGNFQNTVLTQWRPKRPWEQLVSALSMALERIDRLDLARMVMKAHKRQTEFKYTEEEDDDDEEEEEEE